MSLPVRRAASSRARLPMSGLVHGVSHRPASSASKAMTNEKQHVSFKDMVYGNPLGLPRLPIPELKDTVSRYLQVRSSETCLGVFVLTPRNLQVQAPTSQEMVLGFVENIGFLDKRNTRRLLQWACCSGTTINSYELLSYTTTVPRTADFVGFALCCCRSPRDRLSLRQGGGHERTTAFIAVDDLWVVQSTLLAWHEQYACTRSTTSKKCAVSRLFC